MAEMYSFNGVKLPKLPEWDKAAYPYAYVSLAAFKYLFILSPVKMIEEANGGITVPASAGTVTLLLRDCILTTDYWGEQSEREQYYGKIDIASPFWCNEDLYNEDGTLYLAASTPVPVLDHTAMIQGWLIGKRLATMRGQTQQVMDTARLGLGVLGRMILGKE